MSLSLHQKEKKESLYLQVYHHYRELIMDHRLPEGSRMPSLRKCAQELKLSRTTIESAYLQLAADGYIIAKAQSGYYVTGIASADPTPDKGHHQKLPSIEYDFASSGVDRESFRFDLWQRYIKSALRQNDRILSYGEPQGESDLRQVLSEYVRQRRNVSCSPEDIVIGAGVQSLLHILCPLVKDKQTVSFPTPSFIQGSTVFSDHGFQVDYRNKDCDVIYVSPAHMTKWGEIMPVSRRMELVHHASENGSLIIEDDYENEFVYFQRPTPSLFNLAGGHGVVYIGSFSRLLLPSIRLSFMVLPPSLSRQYAAVAERYSQTASKVEQIALCQFIRDGHLTSQTKKLKKLYAQKLKELKNVVQNMFGESCTIQTGAAGTSLALTVPYTRTGLELKKEARMNGLSILILEENADAITLLLSCSSIATDEFVPSCRLLKNILN